MKLVEILAMELEVWPKGVYSFGCDEDGEIRAYNVNCGADEYHNKFDFYPKECVDDKDKANGFGSLVSPVLVTRADWEAERAKLKAPKANGDGWIRHRGGKCPVEADVVVDVRLRCGTAHIGVDAEPAGFWTWEHSWRSKDDGDIMAYRIHKLAEQTALVSEETIKTAEPGKFDAIAIRDRIRALDTHRAEVESTYQRQISEITQERDSLVQELAGEGLALVEVVVGPVEDMSDWRSWRAGDWVVGGGYSKPLKVSHVEGAKYDGKLSVYLDGIGWTDGARFTFYSRPAI